MNPVIYLSAAPLLQPSFLSLVLPDVAPSSLSGLISHPPPPQQPWPPDGPNGCQTILHLLFPRPETLFLRQVFMASSFPLGL